MSFGGLVILAIGVACGGGDPTPRSESASLKASVAEFPSPSLLAVPKDCSRPSTTSPAGRVAAFSKEPPAGLNDVHYTESRSFSTPREEAFG